MRSSVKSRLTLRADPIADASEIPCGTCRAERRRMNTRTRAASWLMLLLGACAVGEAPLSTNEDVSTTTAARLSNVPPTAALFGVHETAIFQTVRYANPFRDVQLNATYRAPSGRVINFFGFFDGDGAGGQRGATGDIWRIRFMPDEVGPWSVNWWFTDGSYSGSGTFTATDTGLPGPARLDPANPKLLADARGRPIHWRGYGLKHRGSYSDPPVQQHQANAFLREMVDGQLIAKGYNAAYVMVPTGWPSGQWNSIWGDYVTYDLNAAHYFDAVIQGLHQRQIWTIGWITFGLQSTVPQLAQNYQPLQRYFVARYAAYYNYFMWSPMWEVFELGPSYVAGINTFMTDLQALDPWKRLQGAHDQAHAAWQGWQSIHPRQAPSRTVKHGNNRTTGVEPSLGEYSKVIIGSEDLWEFCSGAYDKPRNATEVRRGLFGELFANVLPLYDEHMEGDAPCNGLGNGSGGPIVRAALDWWYANVNYRDPAFTMMNHVVGNAPDQICSGIPGRQYVIYDQDGGLLTVDLTGAPASTLFSVLIINATNGAQLHLGNIAGGARYAAQSPIAGDSIIFLRAL